MPQARQTAHPAKRRSADGTTAKEFLKITNRQPHTKVEDGLLGLAFHSRFQSNGLLHIYPHDPKLLPETRFPELGIGMRVIGGYVYRGEQYPPRVAFISMPITSWAPAGVCAARAATSPSTPSCCGNLGTSPASPRATTANSTPYPMMDTSMPSPFPRLSNPTFATEGCEGA